MHDLPDQQRTSRIEDHGLQTLITSSVFKASSYSLVLSLLNMAFLWSYLTLDMCLVIKLPLMLEINFGSLLPLYPFIPSICFKTYLFKVLIYHRLFITPDWHSCLPDCFGESSVPYALDNNAVDKLQINNNKCSLLSQSGCVSQNNILRRYHFCFQFDKLSSK